MATCRLTNKKPNVANNVSHANNKTKRRQFPNVQVKRVWYAEEGRWVRLPLSTRAIRTLNHMGLAAFAKKNGLSMADILR